MMRTIRRYFLLLAVLLAACATTRRAEFPATRPTGRGQKPYLVNGVRYEPLSTHVGFEQEGIASSYGSDFHGRPTSSGELFDMNAMTAAHKTLPLGVYVRVRDARNGREVVVRINDRGPFVGERIIDLSEGAARRLGILEEGLAPVRVTALGYLARNGSGKPTFRAPDSYDRGSFALQVAAFTSRDNALRLAAQLRRGHEAADIRESQVAGRTFYRVRLGRYGSLGEAQASQNRQRADRFPGCFVVALD